MPRGRGSGNRSAAGDWRCSGRRFAAYLSPFSLVRSACRGMWRLRAGPARLSGESCPLPSSFPPAVPALSRGGVGGRAGAVSALAGRGRQRPRDAARGRRGQRAAGGGRAGGASSRLFPQPRALVPAGRAVRGRSSPLGSQPLWRGCRRGQPGRARAHRAPGSPPRGWAGGERGLSPKSCPDGSRCLSRIRRVNRRSWFPDSLPPGAPLLLSSR